MTVASPSPSKRTGSFSAATTAGGRAPQAIGHLSSKHLAWLEARGLDVELVDRLGIESAVVPGGGDWVAYPVVRNGAVVNHKYRRIDGKDFRQDVGAEQWWWNGDVLADKTLASYPVVVTEGENDAIAAIQAGFPRTVSFPGGAPSKETQGGAKYAVLERSQGLFSDVRDIIIAADGDPAGMALLNDLSLRLGRGRCRYVTYPEGCKDLNDVLLAHGERGVAEAINGAKHVKVVGLYRMGELPPVPDARPYDSGFPGLAPHYRLRRGDLSVITGIPGHGKSTFVNDIACRMVEEHGWNVCFASFEQHPTLDHKRALTRWKTGEAEENLSPRGLVDVSLWMDRHFSFIVPDDEEDADLEWVLDLLATAVCRHGADMVVIDPWNELDHARPKDTSLTEYVGWAIRQLKRFARRWQVHLVVVAHPTKLQKGADGKLPMPTLYDISDSAHWFNKPDVGVIIHQDMAGTLVRVAKSRYHDRIGKPETINVRFDPFLGRYVPPV